MEEARGSDTDSRIITQLNPHVEIMLHQASEMKNSNEYLKAIAIYDQVLEIDPRNARALHSKGNVFDILGRFDDAISCYESALECDPFNAETWFNKGVTLNKVGCESDSIECIQRGISIATGM